MEQAVRHVESSFKALLVICPIFVEVHVIKIGCEFVQLAIFVGPTTNDRPTPISFPVYPRCSCNWNHTNCQQNTSYFFVEVFVACRWRWPQRLRHSWKISRNQASWPLSAEDNFPIPNWIWSQIKTILENF